MTLEKIQELNERFPFVKISDEANWLEEFEGTGWYPIILQMCEDCLELLGEEVAKYWEWYQFKEKFGSIALYNNLCFNAPMNVIEEWVEKREKLDEIVYKARLKTLKTCYFCGKPAVDHMISGWYYIGRCEECLDKYNKKKEAEGKK